MNEFKLANKKALKSNQQVAPPQQQQQQQQQQIHSEPLVCFSF